MNTVNSDVIKYSSTLSLTVLMKGFIFYQGVLLACIIYIYN